MQFEKTESTKLIGRRVGYIFSYFLFTTILYFIFIVLEKMPDSWTYFHVMGITLAVLVLGLILKKALK